MVRHHRGGGGGGAVVSGGAPEEGDVCHPDAVQKVAEEHLGVPPVRIPPVWIPPVGGLFARDRGHIRGSGSVRRQSRYRGRRPGDGAAQGGAQTAHGQGPLL